MVTIGAFFTIILPLVVICWLWEAHDNGAKAANESMKDTWGCGIGCFLVCAAALALFVVFVGFCMALGG